jgi:hypothetical protein
MTYYIHGYDAVEIVDDGHYDVLYGTVVFDDRIFRMNETVWTSRLEAERSLLARAEKEFETAKARLFAVRGNNIINVLGNVL